MGARQIGCIVAIGIVGLVALAIMAGYGASQNPRLWVKSRVEARLPVVVESYEAQPSNDPFRKGFKLRVRPRDGAAPGPPQALAERVALEAVEALRHPEAPRLDFARVVVEVAGAPPREFQRFDLEREAARGRARRR